MTAEAVRDTYVLDLSDPELSVDPYRIYARLRANRGVYYVSPDSGRRVAVLSRYSDVQLALRDARFGRAGYGELLQSGLGDGPLSRSLARWMLFQDPPQHTRLRGLVNQAFSPRAVTRLRDSIVAIVRRSLDEIAERETFDLIANFAAPLPVLVICELLGVPESDRQEFGSWSAALAASLDHLTQPETIPLARGDAAAAGLTSYFERLLAGRRAAQGDDVLSSLLNAAVRDNRLTQEEILATSVLLFFAGHETTVNLIGNGVLALLMHPHQLAWLQSASSGAAAAVEELLRFDTPVQRTGRFVLEDVALPEGDVLEKGELVTLLIGAANRDCTQFTNAEQLDLARPNAGRHLSFGAGMHYCVGAPLARLEAEIAMTELIRRRPKLRLVGHPDWRPNLSLRGLSALPVAS